MTSIFEKYLSDTKTRPKPGPQPLTAKEAKELKDLETFRGSGFDDYLKFIKNNKRRQYLRHKSLLYMQSLCGGCPPGTVYDPELNECVPV